MRIQQVGQARFLVGVAVLLLIGNVTPSQAAQLIPEPIKRPIPLPQSPGKPKYTSLNGKTDYGVWDKCHRGRRYWPWYCYTTRLFFPPP